MSIAVRKEPDAIAFGLALAHNLEVRDRVGNETTNPHADVTSAQGGSYTAPSVTALQITGSTTDLDAVCALANNARWVLLTHFADGGTATNAYGGAHKAPDTVNAALIALSLVPKATDQTTANALLNAEKAVLNAHMSQAGVHFTNDGVNSVGALDADDLASSKTLAAQIKSVCNAHMAFASATQTLTLVEA